MITVIAGPVKAGKSKKLIEYYEQLKDYGAMVFSSKFSLTHGEDVVSRYGTSLKAIPINSLFDIPAHIPSDKSVFHILVDEFQFLQMNTGELKAFFDKYYYNYDFYIFGLSDNYKKEPFKLMANVMAMADKIFLLSGNCDICKNQPSRYSLRLKNGKPVDINEEDKVILLDGDYGEDKIEYLSVCRECWRKIYYDKSLQKLK